MIRLISLNLFVITVFLSGIALADGLKNNDFDPTYDHDHWRTSYDCIIKDFRAYRSCFDDFDDDNNDGIEDAWGVPQWVAYQIKRTNESCINTSKIRPKWFTDPELFDKKIKASCPDKMPK